VPKRGDGSLLATAVLFANEMNVYGVRLTTDCMPFQWAPSCKVTYIVGQLVHVASGCTRL
jgi:hypothetical protein